MAIGTAAPLGGFAKYGIDSNNARTAADKIFKEFYLPAVRDLLNSKRILTRYIRRNTQDISGNQAVIALNTARNEGVGFVGEQGKLPDPGKQQYKNATYNVKYDYGRILFTGPAVASSRNQRGAFIRIMDGEIKGLARDMQHENNRVQFGDGSGKLAAVLAHDNTAETVTLTNPGGFTNTGPGTQYVRPDMIVSLVTDAAAPTARLSAQVAANAAYRVLEVDAQAGTIKLDNGNDAGVAENPLAIDDTEFLVRASEQALTTGAAVNSDTGWKNEPWGLAALIDEGNPSKENIGGLDANAIGSWNAAVIENGGLPVPFNQDMLQQGMDHLDILGDGTVNFFMTTHGIRRQYLTSLVSNKRYVNTMQLDGGFKALEYDGIPMVIDKDCTRGRIYGLDLETLHMFSETDYQWMDADGSILQRLPNHDAYQATLYRYWELGTDARNRNLVIKDIEDV